MKESFVKFIRFLHHLAILAAVTEHFPIDSSLVGEFLEFFWVTSFSCRSSGLNFKKIFKFESLYQQGYDLEYVKIGSKLEII